MAQQQAKRFLSIPQQFGAVPTRLRDVEAYLLVIFSFIVTFLMPATGYSSGQLMPVLLCVCVT